jgi:actin-related protein
VEYELPDGRTLALGTERFACAEVLFQPRLQLATARGAEVRLQVWWVRRWEIQ